jgi:hypothetical protein
MEKCHEIWYMECKDLNLVFTVPECLWNSVCLSGKDHFIGNVRSLNWSVSITTVDRELTIYKLDLVGVQKVRWDTGVTLYLGLLLFLRKIKRNSSIRKRSFVPHRIILRQLRRCSLLVIFSCPAITHHQSWPPHS